MTKTSLVLAFTFLCGVTTAGVAAGDDLFPDKNLESAVRQQVFAKRGNSEPLTEEDVRNISVVRGKNKGIKNLAGLEKCLSLHELDLEGNEIEDLAPLKELSKIQSLNLAGNKVSDLAPLASLTGIQYLELSNNQVQDLKPLAKIASLRSLYLSGNQIEDLGPLGELKLWSLYLDGNRISDLAPIATQTKVTSLDLRGNQVADLSPIGEFTELKYLLLDGNKIADLAVLVAMAAKDAEGEQRFAPYCNIYLKGNPLSDEAVKTQLPELKKLVKLVDFP